MAVFRSNNDLRQMSYPLEGSHANPYTRSPSGSHTLPPGHSPHYMYVSDEAIMGSGMATLPQQIRERFDPSCRDDGRTNTISDQRFNLGCDSPIDSCSEFEDMLYGDEEKKKEREILKKNRACLTEYVHDCTVLFPYMVEKNVFNRANCDHISHEITGIMKMNTFIDIVLTKGPHAIGVFHESLDHHYPAVFDVLSGLFTNAGISLPPTRQKKEREFDEELDIETEDHELSRTITNRGRRGREGVRTIRKRLVDLGKRCEIVQNQRDNIQSTLRLREQEIDSLIGRIDAQDAINSELMSKLQHWRQTLTDQSNGSIQQLGEILVEKESIQKEYSQLAGELDLTVSELMAARDRIGKLLKNLDRTDKQVQVTVEANEKLKDTIGMQDGQIQMLLRKIERIGTPTSSLSENTPVDEQIQSLETQLAKVKLDCEELREQAEAASLERKHAINESEDSRMKLHDEKEKSKGLSAKIKELQSQLSDPPNIESVGVAYRGNQVEDSTIFMTTEDACLELGLAVVIREVNRSSKAYLEGVRVGDEIREVNRVKVTAESCKEPLDFARQILNSVSQHVVTLSIRRPATPTFEPGISLRSPMEMGFRNLRKISNQSDVVSYPKSKKFIIGKTSAKSSSASTRSHDTTSDDTRESDDSTTDFSDPPRKMVHSQNSVSELSQSGAVGSPRVSGDYGLWYSNSQQTVKGLEFGGGHLKEDADAGYYSLPGGSKQQVLRRKPGIRKPKQPRIRLSLSMDDIIDSSKGKSKQLQSPELSHSTKSNHRQVIICHGQWGDDFNIIGGRGNGLFIKSNCRIRGLNTGDQILQIDSHPTANLTYAEAIEMISGLAHNYFFMCLCEKLSEYKKLDENSRDNFFVRARYTHHKRRGDVGLDYHKGDIFHVLDTKPASYTDYWRVDRVKSTTGESTQEGYIPVALDASETMDGMSSLPHRVANSPVEPSRRSASTLTSGRLFPVRKAYDYYEPIRRVAIAMPRPVVLLGAGESEVRQGLVEQGVIDGLKFAFCLREPADKLQYMSPDLIVESVVADGQVFKSTVDHVTGAANQGYHCVLCLRHDELTKSSVTSLHPIVILLSPRSRFKGFSPMSSRRVPVDVNYLNTLKSKYEAELSIGEVNLSSGMCLDDALRVVRETVARKQEEVVWERDS